MDGSSSGFEYLRHQVLHRLSELEQKNLFRSLRCDQEDGESKHKTLLDLTTNDYLGLGTDPEFLKMVQNVSQRWPAGSHASRLLGGDHPIFSSTEKTIAAYKKSPSALFFGTGYAANESLATVLGQIPGVGFFSDELIHASMIDGFRLAKRSADQNLVTHIFPHNDLDCLETLLKKSLFDCNVIWVESIYSMDGDTADLKSLMRLAEQYRGIVVVDEAHAFGCRGPSGSGMIEEFGLEHNHIVSVNTCGKAFALQGAFVCGPHWLREYLINRARPFIYSTAPSPWIAGTIQTVVPYVNGCQVKRESLRSGARELRIRLSEAGFNCGSSSSHIIPVIVGEERTVVTLSCRLESKGLKVAVIRPPTVPEKTSRLRLSWRADLNKEAIDIVINAFIQTRRDIR